MGIKGERTRGDIIDKSMQLFSVRGYFNTSISHILDVTRLTKGGLYGHFRSKEEIWYAVYDEAVRIWRRIVLSDVRNIEDPLERIEKTVENDLLDYLGNNVFEGGCFFFNNLVELSGQSTTMSRHILKGFIRFSRLFQRWLREADTKGMLKPGLDFKQIGNFILITMNGAGALYASTRDPLILEQALDQLRFYINQLKIDPT